MQVDQEPIGRSPRSNPATYVGLLDLLRDLFAQVPLAKVRGYKASRFSFNIRGGRCERCQGDGAIKLDMQFLTGRLRALPGIFCGGRRFNRETLAALAIHGQSIADVLAMTVREALLLFRNIPRVSGKARDARRRRPRACSSRARPVVWSTLSGGEAQRIKLSLELEANAAAGRNASTFSTSPRPACTGPGYPAADGPARSNCAMRAGYRPGHRTQSRCHSSRRLADRPRSGWRRGWRGTGFAGPSDEIERACSLTGAALAALALGRQISFERESSLILPIGRFVEMTAVPASLSTVTVVPSAKVALFL